MTERNFNSATWADAWFQELDSPRKLLFIYLWTNPHCSSAGVYEISVKSIAFDTGLPLENVPALLRGLAPKVEWFEESSLIWVKNFIRYQTRSPKFLIAVAKALSLIRKPGIIQAVLHYNNTLSIPYQYPIDTLSVSILKPLLDQTRPDQPKDQTRPEPLPSPPLAAASSGKSLIPKTFEELDLSDYKARFPTLDITWELAKCAEWWRANGKTLKSPRLAFGNWCEKARVKGKEEHGCYKTGIRKEPTGAPKAPSPFAKYSGDSGKAGETEG